jgi:SAM-dependent methyltransferase
MQPSPRHDTVAAVAEFYERIIFPSRSAHPGYARLLPSAPGERLGDFGCGQSIFHAALRDYEPAPVFLDRSENALRTIEYGARVRGDLFHLPLGSATFDRIFCIGVLHHLPERGPVWREIARVLRPGGKLVLGVYAPGSLQSRLRRMYESSPSAAWRGVVFRTTEALVGLRYLGRNAAPGEVRLRTRDFLEVPFAQYVAPGVYEQEAAACALRRVEAMRLAGMNLLVFERR